MANKNCDNTDPCLTPNLIWKVVESKWVHLIHEKQFCNQFSSSSNKITGNFLFINIISSAWWLTLLNALLKSIAHKLTVFPPLVNCSITHLTVLIAWLQCLFSNHIGCSLCKGSRQIFVKKILKDSCNDGTDSYASKILTRQLFANIVFRLG